MMHSAMYHLLYGIMDFMVQGKINRGRHTNHPAGRHSIRTTSANLHDPSIFTGQMHAIPAAQPTAWKHRRQLVHSD